MDFSHLHVFMFTVEQAWCGIYGMAPTIQAQHVVAVTIPTIAVIFFTYLWYKKRSNSVTRGRSDPGGGGGTSKKRNRHRTGASSASSSPVSATVAIAAVAEKETSPVTSLSEEMKTAMQKAIRDLETAAPIQEVCSDTEEAYAEQETTTVASQTVACSRTSNEVSLDCKCERKMSNGYGRRSELEGWGLGDELCRCLKVVKSRENYAESRGF